MTIKFGTEGWRAIIAQEFTFDNVAIVTQAIAEHFLARSTARAGAPALAVGFDARFLSDRFAATVCEVLAGNGVRSILADRSIPTCAVSRYVVEKRLAGGVMITASHNPPQYNGVKVKESFGGSATTETVASIERRIGAKAVKRLARDQAIARGLISEADFLPAYLNGIRDYVDLAAIKRSRFKVLVDAMHGVGDRIAERLAGGGRCRIETLHGEPEPLFGGHAPEPIPQHLTELARELRRRRWDVGLATDGDADRIGAVAPNGMFLNPGILLCILLEHLMKTRRWQGAVVKTVSNTSMIDRLAHSLNLPLMEVPVGFKHVAKLMLEDNVLIGGEESGGIGIRGYLPERDGILMGLMVLEAMAAQNKGIPAILESLERRFGAWRYARRDLTLRPEQVASFFNRLGSRPPSEIAGVAVAEVKTLDGVKLIGKDESWLLFRRSGTEPIVRVYAEGLAQARVKRLLDFGVRLIRSS